MFALTRRRHISYYLSLPVVVAIVFFLAVQLAALQRAEMVAELADQVSHHDTPEATAALRNLAAMPRPPLDVLVEAATSAEPEIADEAQHLINGLLRRWNRQVESGRRVAAVGRQLAALSESLEEQQPSFSRADHRWLSATAGKILRLANRIPPAQAPLVAVHCDAVLAAVVTSDAAVAALVNRDLVADRRPVIAKVVAQTETHRSSASDQSAPNREFSPATRPPSPMVTEVRDSAPATRTHVNPPQGSAKIDHTEQDSVWSYPKLNDSPAAPINTSPVGKLSASDQASKMPTTVAPLAIRQRPLAKTDSRDLLRRWLDAAGIAVFPLEEELTHRGFGRLSARLVEQLFSDDAQDRLRLVDDVLVEPGIDARPWLMLLADDKDADVRLLAVTIMATSADPGLIEKAWQVAIRDRDPRIAGLADRLRDRRESTQRR